MQNKHSENKFTFIGFKKIIKKPEIVNVRNGIRSEIQKLVYVMVTSA